jgi:hypothetical protein
MHNMNIMHTTSVARIVNTVVLLPTRYTEGISIPCASGTGGGPCDVFGLPTRSCMLIHAPHPD